MYFIYHSENYRTYFYYSSSTRNMPPPILTKPVNRRVFFHDDTGQLFIDLNTIKLRGYNREGLSSSSLKDLRLTLLHPEEIEEALKDLPMELYNEWKDDPYQFYNGATRKETNNENKHMSTKEDTNMKMFSANKMMEGMMKDMTGKVVIDMMTGALSIKINTNLYSFDGSKVVENPISDMSVEVPAYAMLTKVEDIKKGDIAINKAGSPFFVLSSKDGKVRGITINGTNTTVTPVKNLLFGNEGILVVKNLFGEMGGDNGMMGGVNPMMLMMMDKGGDNMKDMMMMSMMMGNGGMFPGMGGK